LAPSFGIEAALLNVKRGDGTVLEDVLSWKLDWDRLQLISRYETTLERNLYKALQELHRLQAARDGQAVPLPEAVDIEVSVSGRMSPTKWLCLEKTEASPMKTPAQESVIKCSPKSKTWELF
jgi:hypothetical protein